jgi:hypothetical protein
VQPVRFLRAPPRHGWRREFLDEVDRSIRSVSEQRTPRDVSFDCSTLQLGLAALALPPGPHRFSAFNVALPKAGVICRTRQAAR